MLGISYHSIMYILIACLTLITNSQQDYLLLNLNRSLENGEYYTTIYIGNPPQAQTVVIDNLNSMLMINC
jgi:hypothetical protein